MKQSPANPLPPPKERRRLREAASLTQAQFAARLGVSKGAVRAWESGRTTPRGPQREAYVTLLESLAGSGGPVTGTQETGAIAKATVASVGRTSSGASTVVVAAEAGPGPAAVTAGPLTPAQAFDALYAFCAPALVRQAYLLTGRRELARESVERAFQRAWERWPEVARDRDPAGWVRMAVYEYALSPWHRFRPRYRHPEPPPAAPADRALMDVLLKLPPSYRRTLLLHDGVGLGLPETAAETEASTPATAHRLIHAREALAATLPELGDPDMLHRRLAEVAATERLRAPRPTRVRCGGERRARFWTRAAIAFTVAIIGATALTLRSAPTQYEPPVAPGQAVRGVPPKAAPGPLSEAEVELRAKLRGSAGSGPERLTPSAW
ncbi:helix-turn-helix domain-containing protein [Streptomyces sp. NPDC049915]|uniref:helix-turn-helix domain-containing protein n=1 Tax=Streptomyces sp. NPDC049915 TaxID=3155510 RepID=UPI003415EB85